MNSRLINLHKIQWREKREEGGNPQPATLYRRVAPREERDIRKERIVVVGIKPLALKYKIYIRSSE